MTTDHYPNLHRRAERLTLLAERGARGLSGEIAQRTIRLAFGMEHGIEGFTVGDVEIQYVNRGDIYSETLVRVGDRWIVSTWGDELETAELAYSDETGEQRCAYCSEWTDYVDPDTDKGLCCGALDPESLDFDEIRDGAARALFVSAYADAADEAGDDFDGDRAGSGEDWFDVASETPEAATISATLLLARTAGLAVSAGDYPANEPTDSILRGLCKDWIECGATRDACYFASLEERFGHYLAMEALGSGVGLSDDLAIRQSSYKSPELPDWDANYIDGEFFDTCGTVHDAEKKLAHKLFETGEKAVRNAAKTHIPEQGTMRHFGSDRGLA